MKICWDNLNKLYYDNKLKVLKDKHNNYYYFIDKCNTCNNSYLGSKISKYCCKKCLHVGVPKTEETKRKMSISGKKKFFTKTHRENISKSTSGIKNGFYNKQHSIKTKQYLRDLFVGQNHTPETIFKIRKSRTFNKDDYKENQSFFYKIEEIRNNPDNLGIQVHCKNHNCKNSKEKGGWFTASGSQISERIRSLNNGLDNNYLYCSKECKNLCPLFHLNSGRQKIELYTSEEYQTWRTTVLLRENYICEYCDEPATDVHHSRPQKLEPGFVLDPDFGVACCEKCHYKYGHKTGTECSTGNLANKKCL